MSALITPRVAKRRPAVWLNSSNEWAQLVWVRPLSGRCKVRLVSGLHVWVPAEQVEVQGG